MFILETGQCVVAGNFSFPSTHYKLMRQTCREGKKCKIICELLVISNSKKRPDKNSKLNDCNNHK